MNNNFKISNKLQEHISSIVIDLIIMRCEENDNILDLLDDYIEELIDQYMLEIDPFTGLPCSTKEYLNNSFEYQKQIMNEKYGHCDGLE